MAKYYSVFGTNGYGVLSCWGRVKEAKKNLKSPNIKSFDIYSEAEAYAVNKFIEYVANSHIFDYCVIPGRLKLNELKILKERTSQREN